MTGTTKDTKEGSTQLDIRPTEPTTRKDPFIKNPIKALEILKEITVTLTMTDTVVTPNQKESDLVTIYKEGIKTTHPRPVEVRRTRIK